MRNRLLLLPVLLVTRLAFSAPVIKCADMQAASFGSEVKIESATLVAAGDSAPEHCDVRGTIWPEAKFAIELPTAWTSRFYMVGNGGTAGTISLGAMDTGLRKGYATASTDTGHDAAKEPLATFAYPGPNNPNAERKLIDFAYQAVHETAVLAKQMIKAYYGEAPRYSYWVGCSTGGRQGMMEAQRFPEDFDGLVVGAPQLNATESNMRIIWNSQAQAGAGAIPASKLAALAEAIYKKCDGVDGLQDGLIDDPRRCAIDPARDLPKCAANADDATCFTAGQLDALAKIYGGVRNSAGKIIFHGQVPGAEVLVRGGRGGAAARSGWEGVVLGAGNASVDRSVSYMQYMFLDPRPGPSWEGAQFNFDTDPPKMKLAASQVDAVNPDLRPLKQRGGKILHYHGWADPLISALTSVNYYESVLKYMGDKETKDFYRLFLVPGMFHCSGGVGCGNVDWFTPLADWVEKGVAPQRLIGSRGAGGQTARTRPICGYPEGEKYKGTGSIEEAANFTCAMPASASR